VQGKIFHLTASQKVPSVVEFVTFYEIIKIKVPRVKGFYLFYLLFPIVHFLKKDLR